MKPKVIYLCYLPLIQKREKDFFMDELMCAGINVEYWDVSRIFFPDIQFTVEVERGYVKKIASYAELEGMILSQDIARCYFVIIISFNGMVIKLHRILTKHNCFLIFFGRSGLPGFSANESLLRRVAKNYRAYLNRDKIKQKILTEFAKINVRMGLIKKYDLVFAAGSVEESRYSRISQVISINHFDYDNYLGRKDRTERIISGGYCVFLDDNLVHDTDFKINNMKAIEPALYFTALRNLFDWIEKRLYLKVVVAAHPKAEYQGNEFGGRQVIKNKTNELVKDCQFTMAHYSTSISFAILYKKPIVFIYTKEMKEVEYFGVIKSLAHVLNSNMYCIGSSFHDQNVDGLQINEIDHSKYEDYKYKYLTSKQSEKILSSKVFLRTMREIVTGSL